MEVNGNAHVRWKQDERLTGLAANVAPARSTNVTVKHPPIASVASKCSAEPSLSRLHPKLCGRTSELKSLSTTLERLLVVRQSELVLISGPSGVGKTFLAEQLRDLASESGGYFCVGKFQQQDQHHGFETICGAFSDLCNSVLDSDNLETIRRVLKLKLGDSSVDGYANYLQYLIPSLAAVMDSPDPIKEWSNMMATGKRDCRHHGLARLSIASRKFLDSIASQSHPIVILLDDLHLADPSSMALLKSLLTDLNSHHVLVVATFRDDVKSKESIMSNLSGNNQGQHQMEPSLWPISHIELENLDHSSVHTLLLDLLNTTNTGYYLSNPQQPDPSSHSNSSDRSERIQELSLHIDEQTGGNPYHIMLYLEYLQARRSLWFSVDEQEWNWNLTPLSESNGMLSINDLLASKIQQLDAQLTNFLELAAFTGFVTQLQVLRYVLTIRKNEVAGILNCCLQVGLIEMQNGQYQFTHDLILDFFRTSVSQEKARTFHNMLGESAHKLWLANKEHRAGLVFVAANHLNVTPPGDRPQRDLAQLNLEAANLAMTRSHFQGGIDYCNRAMAWICAGGRTQGDCGTVCELTISILMTQATCYKFCKRYEECKSCVDKIVARAPNLEDKYAAYFILADAFAEQGKLSSINDLFCKVLDNTDAKLPLKKKLTKRFVSSELTKTKRKLKAISDSGVLMMNKMPSDTDAAILKMLVIIATNSFFLGDHNLMHVATFNAVQWTLGSGRADTTPNTFALLGLIYAAIGNHKEAQQYGELSLKLVEAANSRPMVAESILISCGYCLHWERSLLELTAYMVHANRLALEAGDILWSSKSANMLLCLYFAGGRHLFEIDESARLYADEMTLNGLEKDRIVCHGLSQAVLNLTSQANDPVMLTGDIMSQMELDELFGRDNNFLDQHIITFARLNLAVYFQNWEAACILYSKLTHDGFSRATFTFYQTQFFGALAYLALDRSRGNRKNHKKAAQIIKELRKMQAEGPSICETFVLLLEAEQVSTQKDKKGLKKAYDTAIACAEHMGMVNMQALVNERAGVAFEVVDDYLADQYLTEALEYYFQWGAMAKVEQLESDHKTLQSKPKVVTSVASSKGSSTGRKSRGSRSELTGKVGGSGHKERVRFAKSTPRS